MLFAGADPEIFKVGVGGTLQICLSKGGTPFRFRLDFSQKGGGAQVPQAPPLDPLLVWDTLQLS